SAATAKCAMCHGQDGSGSLVGQSISVPDLRSPVAQKLSDAQLARIISDGKGRMPSFKNSLSEAQIRGLVTYVRLLHHPVLFQRGARGYIVNSRKNSHKPENLQHLDLAPDSETGS